MQETKYQVIFDCSRGVKKIYTWNLRNFVKNFEAKCPKSEKVRPSNSAQFRVGLAIMFRDYVRDKEDFLFLAMARLCSSRSIFDGNVR